MVHFRKFPRLALFTASAALLFGASAQAAAPVFSVAPTTLVFNYTAGGAAPAAQIVTISADQAAQIASYSTVYTGASTGWLAVFPLPGQLPISTPLSMMVYATPTGLSAGNYSATITYTTVPAAGPTSVLSFTVFLTVSGGSGGGTNFNETMTVAPASLAFSFQPGSAVPAAQVLAVTTSDSANITTAVTTNDGNPWLLVSPASSVTPGNLSVSINPATLSSGSYTGTLTISAPNAVTQVVVTLTVGSVGLSSAPTSITINEPQNYGVSVYQPINIAALSKLAISISAITDIGNWLQVDANNATTPATINVRANDSGLAQGTYTGMVTVQSGPNNVLQIPVTLNVGVPAPVQLQPSNLTFTYQINDSLPALQTFKVNSLTGSPVTFTVAPVTNDGGKWLTAVATTATTPGLVSVAITPAGLAAGVYSGLVNVVPSVTNASPQPVVVTLTVKPAPVPTILSVLSAASYVGGAVAPGEIVVIFGSNIGPGGLTVPPNGTAPQTLANTSATFDGIPAPVYYVSATQTSVQVPYNIVQGQTVLKLTYNGVSSAGTTIPSLPTFPGLFTVDSSGQRQLAALNADLSLNSASNPVTRGTTLVLYGTGEGQTNPASVEGARVPIIVPLPQTQLPVAVTIGGQNATVQYAGETPGLLSGLLQINVIVPANTPVGSNIPVQVNINGQMSQPNITVAVK